MLYKKKKTIILLTPFSLSSDSPPHFLISISSLPISLIYVSHSSLSISLFFFPFLSLSLSESVCAGFSGGVWMVEWIGGQVWWWQISF